MKCSRRKAPIGTMPLSECRRRNRNEVPSPARSGATPGLIFGAGCGTTGLAVDATMTAPYMVRCPMCKLAIIVLGGRRSQGRSLTAEIAEVAEKAWLTATETASAALGRG